MEKNDPKNEGIHPKALLITEDRTPKGVLSGTSSHLSTVPSSTLAYSFRSSKASSVSSLNVILTFSGTILKKGDASRRVLSSLLSGMSMLGAFTILPPFQFFILTGCLVFSNTSLQRAPSGLTWLRFATAALIGIYTNLLFTLDAIHCVFPAIAAW